MRVYLIALAALATPVTFWRVEAAESENGSLLLKTPTTGRLTSQLLNNSANFPSCFMTHLW